MKSSSSLKDVPLSNKVPEGIGLASMHLSSPWYLQESVAGIICNGTPIHSSRK